MAARKFDSATIVLGMHRSGTSALTGALGLCGLAVPKTVVPANETNQRGFWESATIKSFDDEVLKRLGLTWHSLVPNDLESLGARELEQLRKRASALLKDEYEAGTHILLKEPRLCRLLPLWRPVLGEAAKRVAYTIILRNPVEVAKSLHQRNEFDLNQGMLLWARYTLDAEFHTRGERRAFVSYAGLLDDFRSTLASLVQELRLPIKFDRADVSAIEEYLAPDLRHQKEVDEGSLAGKPAAVTETYNILLGWSEGRPETKSDHDQLDAARQELDHMTVAIADIFETARRDRKRSIDARTQVERNTADLARLQRAFEQFQDLKETLVQQSASLTELKADTGEAVDQLTRFSAALDERQTLENALKEAISARSEAVSGLKRAEAQAAEASEQFELERAQLEAEHRRTRDELEAEHRRTRDELEARSEALKHAEERAGSLDAELQRTKRKYRAAQWEVEREKRAHQASRSQLAAAQAIVAHYRRTALWQAYSKATDLIGRISAYAKKKAPSERRRRAEQLQTIASSGLFDSDWYLATYPDVAAASVDPLVHFHDLGWREGRDPGPEFATSGYLKANPDVARSGLNPLLHYIEFGRSEGRETREHRAPDETAVPQRRDFSEPAPVFSGENVADQAVSWNRSYRFAPADDRLVAVRELMIGYAQTAGDRSAIEEAFELLASLSGLSAAAGETMAKAEFGSAALVDAWYTNRTELRTRWGHDRAPCVVRAYQHNAFDGGRLTLVGEGLLASELDVVDFNLKNPFFPLLVTFADAEGILQSARLMPFPSLSRGGLHYPELLAGYPNAPDPLQAGLIEAGRLMAARSSPDRLVHGIAVDFSTGDGTFPFSDAAFRSWLEDVAQIRVDAAAAAETEQPRPKSSILTLASDMIPTIRILGERAGTGDLAEQSVFLPLLIAGTEPSQPATLVELPRCAAMKLGTGASGYPPSWPRFDPGENGRVPISSEPAAIRLPDGREIGDSELLVPCPGPALSVADDSAAGLTWLISAPDWQPEQLVQAIRALSLQAGAAAHVIGFVGQVEALSRTAAQKLFDDRVHFFADLLAAADGIDTPLAGHLGPGVILHDPRSTAVLESLLSDASITSATCILVATEKRGKGWHTSAIDGGAISLDLSEGRTVAGNYGDSALPWRATIAISRPPRDLWVARGSSVKSWIKSGAHEPLRKGMHVSTSLVTASYAGERAEHAEEVPLPSATPGRSAKMRLLFG
jgi:hypothetical protein